jgi:flagellar hook-associated protein 2
MGIQMSGLISGMDTTSIIEELMAAEYTRVETVEADKTLTEWKQDAWEEMNTEIYSFYKNELYDFKSNGTYLQKTVTSSDESVATASANSSTVTGSHTINVTQMAKASFLTSDELTTDINGEDISNSTTAGELIDFDALGVDSVSFQIRLSEDDDYSEVTIEEGDTISEIISNIEDLDLDININFDTEFNRIFISSKDTGEGIQLALAGDEEILSALGFEDTSDEVDGTNNLVGSEGQNCEFTYNGTALISTDNDITVNDLSLDVVGTGEVTISVNTDTDAVYETVKSFITAYNTLLATINEKTDAEYVLDDYQPLTDDEKEAMTDDEIEDWEALIQGSILRNDDILESIGSAMRSILTTSTGVDTSGFTYNYLSDLGITTYDYTEQGQLHIKGDDEDSYYSGSENELLAAIEDDPEGVMELFTALGDALYDKLTDKMKSSSLSSALTFYNDKYLDDLIEDYEDDIEDLEDELEDTEDRYYSQFTAMEIALQESESMSSYFSSSLSTSA